MVVPLWSTILILIVVSFISAVEVIILQVVKAIPLSFADPSTKVVKGVISFPEEEVEGIMAVVVDAISMDTLVVVARRIIDLLVEEVPPI
jgi:hypothetical protein